MLPLIQILIHSSFISFYMLFIIIIFSSSFLVNKIIKIRIKMVKNWVMTLINDNEYLIFMRSCDWFVG